MAAIIKPIEARSVHQIQSGQVIVDLCSVVKELVENGLDAQATTIEVRFKNYGLDGIEVQDNGTGISESNYESIALKHYTSKLSSYDDLSRLQTFGFRGEALSSLCAVSTFTIQTAQAQEAPKGKRLEFEISGKLKSTTIVATQKGTTAIVENLFARLPVRQKELNKNIKREYGKVLGLLHAYACISTLVKFTVKNTSKGKNGIVFSTKSNTTTRDNIANVYGAKMLSQLVELNMQFDLPSAVPQPEETSNEPSKVTVVGHISKPVFGEGRQTPDRQMFFVNGRPCGLPQIAKAINEVYKSYNVSQSPFICADLKLDTNSYDVNVSPDKRTIFLHDANALTDGLKSSLTDQFDKADQTVPQSQRQTSKIPSFRPLPISRMSSKDTEEADTESETPVRSLSREIEITHVIEEPDRSDNEHERTSASSLFKAYFGEMTSTREELAVGTSDSAKERRQDAAAKRAEKIAKAIEKRMDGRGEVDEYDDVREISANEPRRQSSDDSEVPSTPTCNSDARIREQEEQNEETTAVMFRKETDEPEQDVTQPRGDPERKGVVPSAFDRMRPRRLSPELATITIGDKIITRMIGTPQPDSSLGERPTLIPQKPVSKFSRNLAKFESGRTGNDSIPDTDGNIEPFSTRKQADRESSPNGAGNDFRSSEEKTAQSQSKPRRSEKSDSDIEDQSVSTRTVYNEATEKAQERNRVKELIRIAEDSNIKSNSGQRREARTLKSGSLKDSTVNTLAIVDVRLDDIKEQSRALQQQRLEQIQERNQADNTGIVNTTEEERLSLTISKGDFAQMHVAGQFNLGFIIALRQKGQAEKTKRKDELFIIDQHASDEKYNFERLQAETVVGNQRLVHPVMLDLTAVEEEIVLENAAALQHNGFVIETDLSGELPVGQRCQLMSLPLSKETTLGIRDLEELIHLLSETHMSTDTTSIPRPTKIRKMFAMRACRSSIMIGKTLSKRQMRVVLEHMGTIDKPWNCPHGRPTMRHLISLDDLGGQLWNEGDGIVSGETADDTPFRANMWKEYLGI